MSPVVAETEEREDLAIWLVLVVPTLPIGVVAAVRWLIVRDHIDGVVNIASPNPLPNAEFMHILREACGVRLALPAKK